MRSSLSYIPSRFFSPLVVSFLSLEQKLRRQWPLLRRMEIGASPLNSLGICFHPKACIELYRASDATRSALTRTHVFSRSLGGSCVVCAVRKDDTSYPVGGSADECRGCRACVHCARGYPRSHASSRH